MPGEEFDSSELDEIERKAKAVSGVDGDDISPKSVTVADDYQVYVDGSGNRVVEHLPSGTIWKHKADGTLVTSSLSADSASVTNQIDTGSLSAKEAETSNETFIRGSRGAESSSTTSTNYVNLFDGKSRDVRGEFNSSQQFSPDKNGEYEVTVGVALTGSATVGDEMRFRIRNVTDGTSVPTQAFAHDIPGLALPIPFAAVVNLNSSKTYELQATDNDSSFQIDTRTVGTIRRLITQ